MCSNFFFSLNFPKKIGANIYSRSTTPILNLFWQVLQIDLEWHEFESSGEGGDDMGGAVGGVNMIKIHCTQVSNSPK